MRAAMQTIDRQIAGAIVLVILINIIYLAQRVLEGNPHGNPPPYSEQKAGYKTIELTGNAGSPGIYFVSPGTTLSSFLDLVGEKAEGAFSKKELDRVLASGDVVTVFGGDAVRSAVAYRALKNSKRQVLDMPMDLNKASAAELMLVSGIGEKTAAAIIGTRNALGGFGEVDDLLEVRGIGLKKFEKIRKFFYVESKKIPSS